MSPIEILAVGHERIAGAQPAAQAIAQEFETLFLKLLLQTAQAPGSRSRGMSGTLGVYADLFTHELAASHSLGFGDMVLRALDQPEEGVRSDGRRR